MGAVLRNFVIVNCVNAFGFFAAYTTMAFLEISNIFLQFCMGAIIYVVVLALFAGISYTYWWERADGWQYTGIHFFLSILSGFLQYYFFKWVARGSALSGEDLGLIIIFAIGCGVHNFISLEKKVYSYDGSRRGALVVIGLAAIIFYFIYHTWSDTARDNRIIKKHLNSVMVLNPGEFKSFMKNTHPTARFKSAKIKRIMLVEKSNNELVDYSMKNVLRLKLRMEICWSRNGKKGYTTLESEYIGDGCGSLELKSEEIIKSDY